MKTFFVIAILFVFLFVSNSFAQTNCYTPPTIWYRVINQPVYKWYWDGQLNGATFDGYDHILSTTEKQTIVRNAINWAVNYWKSTVNTNGIVIEDMSETSQSNAQFSFQFGSVPVGQAAYTLPNVGAIWLSSDTNLKWTDIYSYADEGHAVDIRTIILHELGHIFLGGGHGPDDGTSLMWNIYPGPFRYITACDRQAF